LTSGTPHLSVMQMLAVCHCLSEGGEAWIFPSLTLATIWVLIFPPQSSDFSDLLILKGCMGLLVSIPGGSPYKPELWAHQKCQLGSSPAGF
jgi:hypothetical protein